MFDSAKYKNQYNKDHYHTVRLKIPKKKKSIIDELVEKTGKSINRIFIEAVENQYNVNLTASDGALEKLLQKKIKALKELGVAEEKILQLREYYSDIKDDMYNPEEIALMIESKYSKLLHD